jgi:hypothetical protein
MINHEYREDIEQMVRVVRKADRELRYTICGALVWLGVAAWVVWELLGVIL